MKTFRIYTLVFALLFGPHIIRAAQGSFNTSIPFGGGRNLACYVPINYDSTKAYRLMICLHGAGDNATNYRNAIINSLGWNNLFQNTIFVCPDGGSDNSHDFYQPEGDEEIIPAALDYATRSFHIDSNTIILQGFSLGGRSALKYGLDNPTRFYSLLLNTPALQGLKDLENEAPASLGYAFENLKEMKIMLTWGKEDAAYDGLLQNLSVKMKSADAQIKSFAVAGMSHGIPGNSVMKYFNELLQPSNDQITNVDLYNILVDDHSCESTLTLVAQVYNAGNTVLKSLQFELQPGGAVYQWTGSIAASDHLNILLNFSINNANHTDLILKATAMSDSDETNNTCSFHTEFKPSFTPEIIYEGFESDNSGWEINNSGSLFGWYMDDQAKNTGKKSIGTFNTVLYFYTLNAIESFTSPTINLSKVSQKVLSFDVAFNYTKYTPPYFNQDKVFADTLEVQASTDCGQTYTTVYKKGGKELATAAEPILNPLSIQDLMFLPSAEEWRRENINLTALEQSDHVVFRFNCISGMGGILNVDNISIGSTLSYINVARPEDNCRIFPTCADDIFTLEFPIKFKPNIRIFDMGGRQVSANIRSASPESITFECNNFPDGLYYVQLTTENKSESIKLIIRH